MASALKELPHSPSYSLILLLLLEAGFFPWFSCADILQPILFLSSTFWPLFPGSSLSRKVFASQPLLPRHLLLSKLIALCGHSWLSLQKTGCSLFVKFHLCRDMCPAWLLLSQTLWSMQTRETRLFSRCDCIKLFCTLER